MAKLMNPLQSSEARGRVGGTVYNTWRGARYAKQQTAPAQPRTTRQLQIRAWTTYLVRHWAAIGAVLIAQWNAYAAAHPEIDWTNTGKRLTGLNWYVRCNLRLLDMAKAILTEPPASAAPAAPEAFVAVGAGDQAELAWTPTADWDDWVDVFIYGPHSAGILPKIQRAKHSSYTQGPSGAVIVTGLLPGTYTFWARLIYAGTGLASTWVTATCVVT